LRACPLRDMHRVVRKAKEKIRSFSRDILVRPAYDGMVDVI
jgi:hypothetical protein